MASVGASSAAETAVSIVAEVIAARTGGSGDALRHRTAPSIGLDRRHHAGKWTLRSRYGRGVSVHGRFLEVPTLEGFGVRLEPLGPQHADDLRRASADGELWRKWTTRIPKPDEVDSEIETRLEAHAAGRVVPWATCRADTGEAVGMTTYLNIDATNRRLEIGSTWLALSAQRSTINAAAKILQLTRAFDNLDCNAVEFRTHWHNHQSRAAIARLGAKQDGVLRNHVIWHDGSLRDTVVFSITATEWPAVRLGLLNRLGE